MAKAKEKELDEAQVEEVAEAPQESGTEVVAADDVMDLLEEDSGEGSSSFEAADLTIPRLGIIQSLSPQRSKSKDAYIEGAEEGHIFDNVYRELRDGNEGILAIPVLYRRSLLEWFPRDSGKGLAKNHGTDFTAWEQAGKQSIPEGTKYSPEIHGEVNDKGQRFTSEGNLLSPTAEYYLLAVDKETGQAKRFVLSMDGTALKQAKLWNSQINQAFATDKQGNIINSKKNGRPIQAPIFYYLYRMKTVPVSNQQGEWFRWEIGNEQIEFAEGKKRAMSVLDLPNGDNIYKEARLFREAVDKEEVKAAEYEQDHSGESDSDPM